MWKVGKLNSETAGDDLISGWTVAKHAIFGSEKVVFA